MKNKYKNRIRLGFQSLILILIGYVALRPVFDSSYVADFEAYCPFGGISAFMSKLNLGSSSCQMGEVQIFLGIGLIIGTIFIGKLFCSYICPIGAVTEWFGKIGEKFKVRFEMHKYLDRPLRSLKYILLFLTLYFTMTSSELFCKTFDPYFASANLFSNGDLILAYAIPAFIITVLGSIFFRLFWCKYLCPLSAASNIFYNVLGAAAVIILFIIANALGAELSVIWAVAGICAVGLISEVFFMRSFGLPFAKVKRVSETCTNCGLCEDKCPQGIKLTEYETVNHIDCNLCTDCVYSCPVKQSLTVNKKPIGKYLAPIAVVLIIAISLGASNFYELTTLSERWGNFENIDDIAVYEQTNLNSLKCYGSARSFHSQISKIKGVYGLDAYAASHSIKIYYDPEEIKEIELKEAIFTPAKQRVRIAKAAEIDSLDIFEIGIDKLFDNTDYQNLTYALMKNKGVYGFTTKFGEPVETQIYYNSAQTNTDEIKEAILVKELELKLRTGGTTVRELEFEINEDGVSKGKIALLPYKKLMFKPYDRAFNRFNEYTNEQLSVLAYPMKEAANPSLYRMLSYLASHLSNNRGIVKISTRYTDEPTAFVYFVSDSISLTNVQEAISADMMKVTFRGGEVKEVENPFKSKPEGNVLSASEVKLDKY